MPSAPRVTTPDADVRPAMTDRKDAPPPPITPKTAAPSAAELTREGLVDAMCLLTEAGQKLGALPGVGESAPVVAKVRTAYAAVRDLWEKAKVDVEATRTHADKTAANRSVKAAEQGTPPAPKLASDTVALVTA